MSDWWEKLVEIERQGIELVSSCVCLERPEPVPPMHASVFPRCTVLLVQRHVQEHRHHAGHKGLRRHRDVYHVVELRFDVGKTSQISNKKHKTYGFLTIKQCGIVIVPILRRCGRDRSRWRRCTRWSIAGSISPWRRRSLKQTLSWNCLGCRIEVGSAPPSLLVRNHAKTAISVSLLIIIILFF